MITDYFTNIGEYDLSEIKRWNGVRTIKSESVAEHTFQVCLISRLISEELIEDNDSLKLKIATKALLHDYDETFTGDIPHPLKHKSSNSDVIKNFLDNYIVEKVSENFTSSGKIDSLFRGYLDKEILDDEDFLVSLIVKLSDVISMSEFILKELSLGNKGLFPIYLKCVDLVVKSSDKLNYFLDNNNFKYIKNTKSLIEIVNYYKSKS